MDAMGDSSKLRHYYTMTKATVENPVVLGSEGSGTIEAIPEGETSFQVGQKAGEKVETTTKKRIN